MKKLLHSVSYAGTWGQARLGVDEFLEKAAGMGFDGVMLMAKRPHVGVLDYGPGERARLRDRLEALGLQTVVLAGYCDLTAGLDRRDIPHLEIQTQYLVALGELGRDLGAGVVRVFTGYESSHADYAEQWRMVVAGIREAAKRYLDLGVVLGVQNHHDLGAGWEQFADLLDEVNEPACQALFDAWAPALHGADLRAAVARLAPRMAHTTVADYQLRPRFVYRPDAVNYEERLPLAQAVPMGEGFIDYQGFFEALRAGGFRGSVAYEMCSPLRGGGSEENLDGHARRFLEWMVGMEGTARDPNRE
jgi:sugar phosphate isomerase/epimerase